MTTGNARLRWLLYGAYGYTGRLVLEAALARGHRPVLAGRDPRRLEELAAPHGLPWVACRLEDTAALERALGDVDLAYHVAGPFTQTAAPMRAACLRTRTHYVDVTGEIPVTRETFGLAMAARRAGVLMLPSSGINTVPTDAVAAFVCARLPGARSLDVAIDTVHKPSSGSLVSMLEVVSVGNEVRRGGRIVEAPRTATRRVRFAHGTRHCVALPMADLCSAWHTTGVPDITAWVGQPFLAAQLMPLLAPLNRRLFAREGLRRRAQALLRRHVQGPDAGARAGDRSQAWACARDAAGNRVEAWLETLEGYSFTGAVAPHIVEAALASDCRGVTTVAAAFGADFVLRVPGTYRYTELP